jgi:AcrR family transcriptional regulator
MVRRGLDTEIVIDTAEQLVDRDGSTNLTMTGLAKKLGVRTPSLYSHVDSVDDVLAGVQARAMRALGEDLQRAAMGRTGSDGFRAMAAALRQFAATHPGGYELALGEPIDRDAVVAASSAAGAAITAMIHSFGVDEVTPELLFTCVSQLHGVLVLDRAGLFRGASLDLDAIYATAVDLVVHLLTQTATN